MYGSVAENLTKLHRVCIREHLVNDETQSHDMKRDTLRLLVSPIIRSLAWCNVAMTLSDAMGKLPGDCMGRFLKGFQPQLNSMADSLESLQDKRIMRIKSRTVPGSELPNIIEKSSLLVHPSALSL